MSEETTQQAVAEETKDSAMQESAEVTGAQDNGGEDDFDKALSEWDASTTKDASPSSQTSTASNDELSAIKQQLESLQSERQRERYQSDMSKVVKQLRGDFAEDEVDDEDIELWLEKQARKDERIANAWMYRDRDPAKFSRTVKALSKEFEKKHARLRKRDDDATVDRMAVSEAVKGASRSAPEHKQPNYSKMTDQEFAQSVQEDYGFRP